MTNYPVKDRPLPGESSVRKTEERTEHILVVEDDEDTRALLIHSLEKFGYTTSEAEDGEVAKEWCREHTPDMIVSDVRMPKLSGTEFVRWYREQPQETFVPILLLTALGQTEDKVAGLDAGADDYLTKPFHLRELAARVSALLRTRELTERLVHRTKELEEAQRQLVEKERELVAAQLAGAAAHSLGQPITTILLQCHVAHKALQSSGADSSPLKGAVNSIEQECETMRTLLKKLEAIDPHNTEAYVEGLEILGIEVKESEPN